MDNIKKHFQFFIENWSDKNEYVIFGAGLWFERLYPYIKKWLKIKYIVDNNPQKQGTEKFGANIFPFSHLLKDPDSPQVLYTVPYAPHLNLDKNNIINCSLNNWAQFIKLYREDQVLLLRADFIITTKCVFNCQKCVALTPYLKDKSHRKIAALKNEIDIFFSHVDLTAEITLIGGEPLLHPDFSEIVRYMCSNYRDRIGHLLVITTGILPITTELLDLCINNKDFIRFSISDYGYHYKKIEKFMATLKEKDIIHYYSNFRQGFNEDAWTWKDFGSPLTKRERSFDENAALFKDCTWNCNVGYFYNSKLYPCHQSAAFAIMNPNFDDGYVLDYNEKQTSYNTVESYQAILSCDLKLKPFLNACQYCDGMGYLNKTKVQPGQQH